MGATTWESVLEELEHRLDRAEHLVASGDAEEPLAWEPPTGLGPLPAHLLPRARAVRERQRALLVAIPPAMASTRQRIQVGRRIGQATTRASAPVYIDVTT